MPRLSSSSSKVSLRPAAREAGKGLARTDGMSLAEHIADLYTSKLIADGALKQADADSFLAERELVRHARDLADAAKADDRWTEHVTLSIFDKMKTEFGELYAKAVGTDFAPQVNRRIGALIKRRLDAIDRKVNGKPVMANAPRGSGSLIKTYTLLYRKPEGPTQ